MPLAGAGNLFEVSLESIADLVALQPTGFALATLTFDALAAGDSPVSLSVNAVSDATGAALPLTVESGSVTVTTVDSAGDADGRGTGGRIDGVAGRNSSEAGSGP